MTLTEPLASNLLAAFGLETSANVIEQKLRRLGKTYRDGLIADDEYELQQRDGLVVPEERSTLQAGHLLENLPLLWEKANVEERHSILNGFLECVYVEIQKPGTVVGIKPKPQFMGLFQFMDGRKVRCWMGSRTALLWMMCWPQLFGGLRTTKNPALAAGRTIWRSPRSRKRCSGFNPAGRTAEHGVYTDPTNRNVWLGVSPLAAAKSLRHCAPQPLSSAESLRRRATEG